jgi:hypothetical protein
MIQMFQQSRMYLNFQKIHNFPMYHWSLKIRQFLMFLMSPKFLSIQRIQQIPKFR